MRVLAVLGAALMLAGCGSKWGDAKVTSVERVSIEGVSGGVEVAWRITVCGEHGSMFSFAMPDEGAEDAFDKMALAPSMAYAYEMANEIMERAYGVSAARR